MRSEKTTKSKKMKQHLRNMPKKQGKQENEAKFRENTEKARQNTRKNIKHQKNKKIQN